MTTPPAILKLADAIATHRPDWPKPLLVTKLEEAYLTRTPAQLHIDALHAALDPDVGSPTVLPLHHATFSGGDCPRCADRERRVNANPKAARCPKPQCGRDVIPGERHECIDRNADHRPNGWAAYQAFLADATAEQKRLRQAIDNDPHNIDLAVANNRRIAELAAEIEVRANNIQPQAQVTT